MASSGSRLGRGYQAHIYRYLPCRADRANAPFLDRAQQLALGLGRHLGNFVEKQGAAFGGPEESKVLGIRAAERALLLPKQLALDQFLRNGRTIERNERRCWRVATLMNRTRHQFFAGAAFADDQDRSARPSRRFKAIV